MQRLVAKATALMALVVLAIHLRFSVPALLDEPWWPARGGTADALALAALLFVYVVAGRLILSFFPPGEPGAHTPARLPATLAVSAVLGAIAVHLEERALSGVSWLVPHWSDMDALARWALVLGPWIVLAVVRALTLPGAMVPRHAPAEAPRATWLRWFALVPYAACVALLVRTPGRPHLWAWLAFLVLLDHGLRVARRAPFGRAWLLLGAALTAEPYASGPEALGAAAGLGIGALFLVPWMRRADRRAGLLAAVTFASLAWYEPTLAVAGFVGLALGAPVRQRPFALVCLVLGTALVVMKKAASGSWPGDSWSETLQAAYSTQDWGLAWVFFTFCSLAGLGIFAGRLANAADRGAWKPGTIEEPLQEVVVLAVLLCASYIALELGKSRIAWPVNTPLVLFPVALLLFGLLLLPPERLPAQRPAHVASATGA